MFSSKRVIAALGALLLSVALLLAPRSAAAQEWTGEPYKLRLDFELPTVGVGSWTNNSQILIAAGLGIVLAHHSGNGAALRFRGGSQVFGADIYTVDLGYLHRFRVSGDDRRGIGITVGTGLALGQGDDRQGFLTTTDGPLPDGGKGGIYADLALERRWQGFLIGAGASYHALLPFEGSGGVQHVVEGHLTLGFGFVL